MKTLSLFTGAGGLDLGLEAAGFEIAVCVESDEDARQTLRENRPNWRLLEPGDIHAHRPGEILAQAGLRPGETGLVAGGPPCQPFSKAAYWVNGDSPRLSDPRADTLRAYLAAVEAALPQVLLLENVNGLLYRGKREGLDFLLGGIDQINEGKGTRYEPVVFWLNSADFGVPQIRERTYVVAEKNGRRFIPPSPTHGPRAQGGCLRPYVTAWEAIGDLDTGAWDESLRARGKWAALLPSIPEGHNYLWHTDRSGGLPLFGWRSRFWSFLLKLARGRPAWTISAHPGPATGPFHWRNRRLSARELCRLQTFPDGYKVKGAQSSIQRQLGNAVAPLIGEVLGGEIGCQLFGRAPRRTLRFEPTRRTGCPPPSEIAAVPEQYVRLIGNHPAHPGVGKGPRASRRTVSDDL